MILLSLPILAFASCDIAFRHLNADWDSQNIISKPAMRLDTRAEFIDLDQSRHGSIKASPFGEVNEHMLAIKSGLVISSWL